MGGRALQLSFLGTPEVRVAGRPVAFRTRKTLALLAYLALEGGRQPRAKLAGLLWPDADPEVGRANLRNVLVYLRSGLGGAAERLAADRESAALRLEPGECDALDLEIAAKAAPSALPDPGVLEGAAGLYRGPLLDGLELGEAGGLDAWLEERRELARAQADAVLGRLSALHLAGAPLAAAAVASRWVGLDRLNEEAWRHLVLARLGAGQRALAREAFEACRRVLQGELGLEPGPETLALGARLFGSPGASPPTRAAPDLRELLLDGPLVGRSDELAQLAGEYHRAARGRPGAVLVEGEPGIGKTRLAAAFLEWAGRQGAQSLRGRAFESGAGTPFAALTDALRRRLRREAEPGGLLGRPWLAELSRLLPELRERLPDLPPPRDDPGARGRLLEALAELGLSLAARAPLVLMIDDLQWADESTLEALHYAAARFAEEGAPVLLVLTARSEGLAPPSSLTARVMNLNREVPLARLELGSLDRWETRQLLDGLAGLAAEDTLQELAGRLFGTTGGHPLYLGETLRSLLERGALSLEGGRLRVDEGRLGGEAPGVRAVIESRLSHLSPAALGLAQAGAILGVPAVFGELRHAAGLGGEDSLAGLEGLLRAGLLREVGGSAGAARYLLSHDRVRETLAASLSPERRRRLHERAAGALEAVHAGHMDEVAVRRARHLEEAGDPERAALAYRQAGEWALRSAAPRDAATLLDRALTLTPATREHQEVRGELLTLIAQALTAFDAGDLAAVEAHWRSAADRARAEGLPGEECEALCSLSTLLFRKGGRHEEASRLAARALEGARAGGDKGDVARALYQAGKAAAYRHEETEAEAAFGQALALARELGDDDLIAASLTSLGQTLAPRGQRDREAARRHFEAALAIRRRQGEFSGLYQVLNPLAFFEVTTGNYAAASRWLEEALAAALREERQLEIGAIRTDLGFFAYLGGEDAAAVTHLRAALEIARRYANVPEEAFALAHLGLSTARLGEREAARAMYREALVLCERNENWARASLTWLALGMVATDLGDDEGAESCYRHALRGMVPGKIGAATVGLAAAKVGLGEWREAAALLGTVMAMPPNSLMRVIWDRAEAALARLRETMPEEELQAALDLGRVMPLEAVVERWAL